MNTLRGENGCDWDKKQTHESLKKYVIEEAYELCQAIDNDDIDEMIEELGDILLQVIFHCQIGKEEGYFDLKEVVNGICTKLINRHPHVFNNVDLDMSQFEKTWEELKRDEKGETSITSGLKRIPNHLPALIKAEKIQHKAALIGFDWDDIKDVFEKIDEEYEDLIKFFRNQSVKDPTDLAAVSFRVQCYIDVKDFDNAEKLCSLLSDELKNPLLEEINKAKTGGTE